jgi:MerR family transcriptional regulator, copper efflux regulator
MQQMTIGKAAQRAGVGVETIRFYERTGLIERPAKPLGSGFREYPEATVRLIHFIRQAQKTGFSLKEIKELASLRIDPDADCSDIRARARSKLDEVKSKIAAMLVMKDALESLIRACPGEGTVEKCSIMDTFATSDLPQAGNEDTTPPG